MARRKKISEALKRVNANAEHGIVRGPAVSESDRKLLVKAGWLVPVFKGWYALKTPDADPGDVTFWGIHYWDFISFYLKYRFKDDYCLSAEHSLDLHTGNSGIPEQLIVMTPKGGNSVVTIPNGNSILLYKDKKNIPQERERYEEAHVWVMTLELALKRVPPQYFKSNYKSAEIALRRTDPGELARHFLGEDDYAPTVAGRLIGALDHLGLDSNRREFEGILKADGYELRDQTNPFVTAPLLPLSERVTSPQVARMNAFWQQMREVVIGIFPQTRRKPFRKGYVQAFERLKQYDTYHSLSIEGYQVTEELIQMVESGEWNEGQSDSRQNLKNALAAKGYAEAFEEVKQSIRKIEAGANPGAVIEEDHGAWFRALFGSSARAGIIDSKDLAGYRRGQVYVRDSRHVPPAKIHVLDLMQAFFKLLKEEDHPAVRAILGHFFFVYIHPYPDGNGRMGRFILNACLIVGAYPWTVIRVDNRTRYMKSIEKGVVKENIEDFCHVVTEEMEATKELPFS